MSRREPSDFGDVLKEITGARHVRGLAAYYGDERAPVRGRPGPLVLDVR